MFFDPVGVNQNAMRFTEAFLIYCLLSESPPFDDRAWDEVARNHTLTATPRSRSGIQTAAGR